MSEAALRTVVRDVLRRLAGDGLPPHHFYITFRTTHPGVEMPDYLRERYPDDMTIVLQHQYWDLQVEEDGFVVTLSFNDQLQRIRVPHNAIKVFADRVSSSGCSSRSSPGRTSARIRYVPGASSAGPSAG